MHTRKLEMNMQRTIRFPSHGALAVNGQLRNGKPSHTIYNSLFCPRKQRTNWLAESATHFELSTRHFLLRQNEHQRKIGCACLLPICRAVVQRIERLDIALHHCIVTQTPFFLSIRRARVAWPLCVQAFAHAIIFRGTHAHALTVSAHSYAYELHVPIPPSLFALQNITIWPLEFMCVYGGNGDKCSFCIRCDFVLLMNWYKCVCFSERKE